MQSKQTLKEADPHDVFAIETVLAAHAHRAPPLAHDSAGVPPATPPVHVAPEISPSIRSSAPPNVSLGAPIPQVDTTFRATDVRDIQVENIRRDEIKVADLKALGERPASKWGKRIFMTLLGLCGAIAAAAWQHYGDEAKAMAADWAPPFVLAALSPSDKPPADEPPADEPASAPAVQTAVADQAAAVDQPAAADQAATATAQPAAPAQPEQGVAPAATAPSAESAHLQSMAQDFAAMGQQVEELKATIAQLKASQAQMARDVAKANEARTSEAKPAEQSRRPRVTAVAPPAPRPAAAPARKPKPAYSPAQATYVPPMPLYPASVQAQPAPPPQQTMADDGAPVVRPPMPLR